MKSANKISLACLLWAVAIVVNVLTWKTEIKSFIGHGPGFLGPDASLEFFLASMMVSVVLIMVSASISLGGAAAAEYDDRVKSSNDFCDKHMCPSCADFMKQNKLRVTR